MEIDLRRSHLKKEKGKKRDVFGGSNSPCDIFSQTFVCEPKDSSSGASCSPPQWRGANGSSRALNRISTREESRCRRAARSGGSGEALSLAVPLQQRAAGGPGETAVHVEGKLFDQHIFLIGSGHPGVSASPRRRLRLHLSLIKIITDSGRVIMD